MTLGVLVGSTLGLVAVSRAPSSDGPPVEAALIAPARTEAEGPTSRVPTTTTSPRKPSRTLSPPKTVPAPASHPSSFVVADAAVPTVALFSSPGTAMAERASVANPTWEGLPLVFLVKEQRDSWLRVLVAARPNGLEAWVRADDVKLRRVPHWIRVEVGARRATIFSGEAVVFQTPVAVGRSSTPTPTGLFFVDGLVRLADTGGVYGYGQMSVSAFSEVYQSFGGGIGQIALHGTNSPGLLGQAVSNGCVRLDNGAIQRLMDLAPTGTPVEIVA